MIDQTSLKRIMDPPPPVPPNTPAAAEEEEEVQKTSPPTFVPAVTSSNTGMVSMATSMQSPSPLLRRSRRPSMMRSAKAAAILSIRGSTPPPPQTITPAKATSHSGGKKNDDDGETDVSSENNTNSNASTAFTTPAPKGTRGRPPTAKVVPASIPTPSLASSKTPTMTTSTTTGRPKRTVAKKEFFSPNFTTPSPDANCKQQRQRIVNSLRTAPSFKEEATTAISSVMPKLPQTKVCPKELARVSLMGSSRSNNNNNNGKLRSLKIVCTGVTVTPKSSFVVRLFAMVHYSHWVTPDICRWVQDGTAVEVHSKHPGLGRLLSHYFQHAKFLSMQRQMNNYGFFNVLGKNFRHVDGTYTGRCIYAHAYFRDDSDPEVLSDYIRYQGDKSPGRGGTSVTGKQPLPRTSSSSDALKSPNKKKRRTLVPIQPAPVSSSEQSAAPPNNNNPASTTEGNRQLVDIAPVPTSLSEKKKKIPPKKATTSNKRSPKLSSLHAVAVAASAAMITQHSRNYSEKQLSAVSGKKAEAKTSARSSKNAVPKRPKGMKNEFGFNAKIRDSIMVTNQEESKASALSTPLNFTKFQALLRLPFPTPVDNQQNRDRVASAAATPSMKARLVSSPEHQAILSSFLQTPSPLKKAGNPTLAMDPPPPAFTPASWTKLTSPDRFRVLFHAAQAVECSPMQTQQTVETPSGSTTTIFSPAAALANHTTPDITAKMASSAATAEPSPIMSMVNMDLSSFRQAMDAIDPVGEATGV